MSVRHGVEVLGLFPSFDSALFGGVQASGRQAWQAIQQHHGDRAAAFFYEPGSSKSATVLNAIQHRTSARTVLIWHTGLLKLVPFIATASTRSVLFLHGIEAWKRQDTVTSFLLRRTSQFLSNSDHTWKAFGRFYPECMTSPHTTVHLGLGQSVQNPQVVPAGPAAALMIGRMQKTEDYKGHREMIGIWPRVLAAVPDAELWIAGGGDLRPVLEELAQSLGVSRQVKFFGAIPDEMRDDLIQRCRVLALPSAGEGFGLVYLEAMRVGRPCIVSTLDAGQEVVNPPEAGLAVDLSNSAGLCGSIVRMLTSGPEWDQASARAKARYDAHFTGSQFNARLIAALD